MMKRRIIEEKLEKLGVGGGLNGPVPQINAPHARAASVRHFIPFLLLVLLLLPPNTLFSLCELISSTPHALSSLSSLDIFTCRSRAFVLQAQQVATISKQLCVELSLHFSSTALPIDTFTWKFNRWSSSKIPRQSWTWTRTFYVPCPATFLPIIFIQPHTRFQPLRS